MKEQPISYETAKLAFEKGYVGKIGLGYKHNVGNYYNSKGELNGDCTELVREIYKARNSDTKPINTNISAPTQSLLQKWLREVHGIHIQVYTMERWLESGNDMETYFEVNLKTTHRLNGLSNIKFNMLTFKTYEEALEKGLQEALELIK